MKLNIDPSFLAAHLPKSGFRGSFNEAFGSAPRRPGGNRRSFGSASYPAYRTRLRPILKRITHGALCTRFQCRRNVDIAEIQRSPIDPTLLGLIDEIKRSGIRDPAYRWFERIWYALPGVNIDRALPPFPGSNLMVYADQ